jgi:hypothetical protein
MNFVAQVEDHLRDLGAEARKTHPGKQGRHVLPFAFEFCCGSEQCNLQINFNASLP